MQDSTHSSNERGGKINFLMTHSGSQSLTVPASSLNVELGIQESNPQAQQGGNLDLSLDLNDAVTGLDHIGGVTEQRVLQHWQHDLAGIGGIFW